MERPAIETRKAIVLCGASLWDAPRLGDRHLAESLSEHLRVLYAEPPISMRRRHDRYPTGRLRARTETLTSTLALARPVVLPGKERAGVRMATDLLARRVVRSAIASLDLDVGAIVSSVPHRDMLTIVDGAVRVYWVKDDYVAGAHLLGLPRQRLERAVAQRAAAADVIVVASPGLLERFEAMGHRPVFLPNGCDADRYAGVERLQDPVDVDLPPPVVGYIGGLSPRIDVQLLEAIVDQGWSTLLVGPRQQRFPVTELRHVLDRPNVRWVGPKPFEDLARYLKIVDVGIIPYRDDPFNRASFPLKALEYLAAGIAVVATDLPALRWLGTGHIRFAKGTESFVDAIAETLSREDSTEAVADRRATASLHSWDRRASQLVDLLGL